ncbi:PREDICTED: cytosolic 5'-nucleotidase 1B-like [Nipponia nippon]|uniref:cytosolic 5'-nucleotidase 1B-like n=1 Tax=Nipponia nippon TaxID=128390 RepID=UPI00051120F3|nr:PREDICTED: cytosolic 5'-nucleotidase 1B-like [Nipponia nippon]
MKSVLEACSLKSSSCAHHYWSTTESSSGCPSGCWEGKAAGQRPAAPARVQGRAAAPAPAHPERRCCGPADPWGGRRGGGPRCPTGPALRAQRRPAPLGDAASGAAVPAEGRAALLRSALEHVNARLLELYPDDEERFDIVLMTNNHAQVGVRLINSINHYGLTIERFCMTGGKSPIGYLTAYLTNLYLSADSEKVQEAIEAGIASATMFTANKDVAYSDTQLRVAFDGDAVLFSDESEQIVKEQGLDRFFEHEQLNENKPLAQGPLKGFLEDLGKLQKKFYAKNERLNCPIRTFLVTARSAASSGARVLKTLRSWGLEIDEALFLAGAPKGPILVKIRPHIFFDDQMFHIEGAQKLGTIAAHVPYGIAQKYHKSA